MSELTNKSQEKEPEQNNVMQDIQGMITDLLKNTVEKMQKAESEKQFQKDSSDESSNLDLQEVSDLNEIKSFVVVMQKFIDNVNVMIAQLEGHTDVGDTDDVFLEGYMATADNVLEIAAFSMKDNLTGLSNRYGFDNRLILEWNRATRDKSALGLLIFGVTGWSDKDNLDNMLKTVSETISNTIKRSTDFVARWSDEEFALLLPTTDTDGVSIVAERLTSAIEKMDVSHITGSSDSVAISIGACVHVPDPSHKPADFIDKAYKAFLSAKSSDTGSVCFG